jgi:hypothetical protein
MVLLSAAAATWSREMSLSLVGSSFEDRIMFGHESACCRDVLMRSQIWLCSLVSAAVGPLLDDEGLAETETETATCTGLDGVVKPRQQQRRGQRHTGLVIDSVDGRVK